MWQVTPGLENIFMFHNSWFMYSNTMRIFKHYHLNVEDSATAAFSTSFSSYPGISFTCISSHLVLRLSLVKRWREMVSRRKCKPTSSLLKQTVTCCQVNLEQLHACRQFLPRDAMQARSMPSCCVRVSVPRLLFFLSYLGWHTLTSHASAEACLTGWPNAQPQGRD